MAIPTQPLDFALLVVLVLGGPGSCRLLRPFLGQNSASEVPVSEPTAIATLSLFVFALSAPQSFGPSRPVSTDKRLLEAARRPSLRALRHSVLS